MTIASEEKKTAAVVLYSAHSHGIEDIHEENERSCQKKLWLCVMLSGIIAVRN